MAGYVTERRVIDAGGRPMKMLVLRPRVQRGSLPGVLWIHGGGYMLGGSYMAHMSRAADLVRAGEAVVLSPAYRLATEAPYPAAAEDCYAALVYLRDHALSLGVAPDQLFISGESAGGGLCAAVCLMARDRRDVRVAFQMPLYPMLDCRDTASSANNHGRVWNTARNHWGWRGYLGELWESDDVPAYASPALEDDLLGMPPAYTFVGDGEPFFAETLAYVRALQAAGIEATCDVYHCDVHAFDMLMPWKRDSKLAAQRFLRHFRDAAERFRAPN